MTQREEYLGRILDNFLETHEKWYAIKQPPVDPFRLVAKLAEELGEVSEAVLAISGSVKKTKKLKEKGVEPQAALKEELGDLFITIANLCKGTGIKIGSFEEILEFAEKKMRNGSVGPAFGERPKVSELEIAWNKMMACSEAADRVKKLSPEYGRGYVEPEKVSFDKPKAKPKKPSKKKKKKVVAPVVVAEASNAGDTPSQQLALALGSG